MYGFQAAGAAPIVLGHRVAEPDTVATAIRIGDPASWTKATAARDESDGLIEAVTHKTAWTVNHGTEVKMAQGLTTEV